MGWLTGIPVPANATVREALDRMLAFDRDGVRQRVLHSALIGMKEYYAAVERIDHKGQREVWAAVILVEIGRGRARGTYGYKDMDETVGPYAARCPARILDLLTDPPNELAAEWRFRCRQAIRDRADYRGLKHGQWIRLGATVNCHGRECDRFRVYYIPGRRAPCFHNGERLYAISERTLASVGFAVIDGPGATPAGSAA
jgi:hypothetical protein